MLNTISLKNITSVAQALLRRRLVSEEAGGRQGRLVSFRKAKAPITRLMNLAWGL